MLSFFCCSSHSRHSTSCCFPYSFMGPEFASHLHSQQTKKVGVESAITRRWQRTGASEFMNGNDGCSFPRSLMLSNAIRRHTRDRSHAMSGKSCAPCSGQAIASEQRPDQHACRWYRIATIRTNDAGKTGDKVCFKGKERVEF